MCPMINILITPDHGLGHNCGSATQHNLHFENTHEIISYILNAIYRIYHAGQDLYDEYRPCQHGLLLQFLIMELVRYDPEPADDDDDDTDDDPDPVVVTIDLFHHERPYLEMLQHLLNVEGLVDRVSQLL